MLRMSIATSRSDRVAALHDGRIRPEGLDITWLPLNVEQIFWRMSRHMEFDASEFSMSGYMIKRSRGDDTLVAIPVFLSRSFRHSMIYVSAASGITRPEELVGRRVGLPEYQMTAAVWARGILEDDHGVRSQDVEWIQGGLEQPGRRPFEPVSPPGIRLSFAPDGETLAGMLAEGRIDALLSPRTPSSYLRADGRVRRLFPDTWAAERDYYARTRIFPIMHLVVVKREIVDRFPWVPQTLANAFGEARRIAMADLRETVALPVMLPFLVQHWEETAALMGEDFWPYGVDANRPTLEAFARYLHRQGLVEQEPVIDELFPASTITTSRI